MHVEASNTKKYEENDECYQMKLSFQNKNRK